MPMYPFVCCNSVHFITLYLFVWSHFCVDLLNDGTTVSFHSINFGILLQSICELGLWVSKLMWVKKQTGKLDVLACKCLSHVISKEALFKFVIGSVLIHFIHITKQGPPFRNSGTSHFVWTTPWSFMLCVLIKAAAVALENVYFLHTTLCSLSAESQARPR